MITSLKQLSIFIRSNRTLGIVFLTGVVVIGMNLWLWQFAADLGVARRAYRALPNAPPIVASNLGKVLWGISSIILGWALWRSRRDLAFRDGRRWPSIALAVNCFTCAAASFCDVITVFFPVFPIRVVMVNIAAWSTLSAAVLFPVWLRQYKVVISKEE